MYVLSFAQMRFRCGETDFIHRPQLVRNVDLARQLSGTGRTSIPYISTLPPWAREVLGPVLEYIFELIGVLIRWLLYPTWRLLPRPFQVILAFFGVLLGSVIILVVTLLHKYWMWSVAFGRFLSRYTVFSGPVRFVIFVINRSIDVFKKHWELILISMSLATFWYVTTPEDLDDTPSAPVALHG
jgi:hypothetical protein